jgi:Zn-dependent M28 family amino/carboxypeptidase
VARGRDAQRRREDPGERPARAHETLIYSAHWDHFGWNPKLPGTKTQQIFHGALDNASGTAALLTLAGAFRTLPQAPPRSLLFIATTGEERGLLVAAYYTRHPLYPLRDTVADLNMDGINPFGRTRDFEIVGYGKSEIDDLATAIAASQGRVTMPDAHPERGQVYRADQFEFARVGVPVLYAKSGKDYIGQPANYGEARSNAYIEHDYHQVSDGSDPTGPWMAARRTCSCCGRSAISSRTPRASPSGRAAASSRRCATRSAWRSEVSRCNASWSSSAR